MTRFYSLCWALPQVKFPYLNREFCLSCLSRSLRVLLSLITIPHWIKRAGEQTNLTTATGVTILMRDLLFLIIQNYFLSLKVFCPRKKRTKTQSYWKIKNKGSKKMLLVHSRLGIWTIFLWLYRFLPSTPRKCRFHRSHVILTCFLGSDLKRKYISEASMVPEGQRIGFFSNLIAKHTSHFATVLICPLALGF